MNRNIKSWWHGEAYWNGEPITYATSDEPSPKEAIKVVVLFIVPLLLFLTFVVKCIAK